MTPVISSNNAMMVHAAAYSLLIRQNCLRTGTEGPCSAVRVGTKGCTHTTGQPGFCSDQPVRWSELAAIGTELAVFRAEWSVCWTELAAICAERAGL
jgi:hypothetical protein